MPGWRLLARTLVAACWATVAARHLRQGPAGPTACGEVLQPCRCDLDGDLSAPGCCSVPGLWCHPFNQPTDAPADAPSPSLCLSTPQAACAHGPAGRPAGRPGPASAPEPGLSFSCHPQPTLPVRGSGQAGAVCCPVFNRGLTQRLRDGVVCATNATSFDSNYEASTGTVWSGTPPGRQISLSGACKGAQGRGPTAMG